MGFFGGGGGGGKSTFKKKKYKKLGEGGVFFFIGSVDIPSLKMLKTFPGPIRSFTVKENHFGSRVSKILQIKNLTALYTRITSGFAHIPYML